MKPYIQKQYRDNLFTQVYVGSEKSIKKLDETYNLIRPFALEQLKSFRKETNLGRLGHDPEVLFKMLFLEHFHALSDNGVIEGVKDRISFRKFMCINHDSEIPSRRALVEFRKEFFKNGCPDKMFKSMVRKVREKDGKILKSGTMVDSQIIDAQGFKSKEEKRRDRTAKKTCKGRQVRFGYKAHIGADVDTKLIKKGIVTTANVHDSKVADKLIDYRKKEPVYGDKGYTSKRRDEYYKEKGIKNCTMRKRYKGMEELPHKDGLKNKKIAKKRARVEHIFGRVVQEFKYTKMRYFNMRNNRMATMLVMAMYNAKVCAKNNYL